MLREPCMDERFEPTIVLHAFGHCAADDANMVALLEFETIGIRERREGQHE